MSRMIKYCWSILLGLLFLFGLWATTLHSYLLFHGLAEIFSIVVAFSIFILAWNSCHFVKNSYLLFIGIAYLFVGGLDLTHTLAYKGMVIFSGDEANLSTQLWIAARYVEGISLLIASFFIGRKLKTSFVLIGYILITAVLLGSIFYWNVFPVCFIEGEGLTIFKKASEYIISFILIASIIAMLRKQNEVEQSVLRLLIASIVVTVASELAFTLYTDVYGFSNLLGHYLKIISFYLIYLAVIKTGLTKPYALFARDIKQSEEELLIKDEAIASSITAIGITDLDGKLVYVNNSLVKMWGYDNDEEILGRFLPEFWEGDGVFETIKIVREKGTRIGEDIGKRKDGSLFHVLFSGSMIKDKTGSPLFMFGSFLDITSRKEAEEAAQKSQNSLRFFTGKLITAQEEERRRLAREMHDDLTQQLALLAIDAGKLENESPQDDSPMRAKLQEMKKKIIKLSKDIHDISRQIHPAILDDLGLVDAIKSECDTFTQREEIQVEYEAKNVPGSIPRNVAICIYRIIQESLRNVAKHAETDKASVSLIGCDGNLFLTVRDNGIGFDAEQIHGRKGIGITSIEERARLIQGELSVQSKPGEGTVIKVKAPCTKE